MRSRKTQYITESFVCFLLRLFYLPVVVFLATKWKVISTRAPNKSPDRLPFKPVPWKLPPYCPDDFTAGSTPTQEKLLFLFELQNVCHQIKKNLNSVIICTVWMKYRINRCLPWSWLAFSTSNGSIILIEKCRGKNKWHPKAFVDQIDTTSTWPQTVHLPLTPCSSESCSHNHDWQTATFPVNNGTHIDIAVVLMWLRS